MFRNLTENENLEEMRSKLSKANKRPVYICSAMYLHGTHHKRPGSNSYGPLGRLEAYLSKWTDRGICVKRDGDFYYYDLEPSSVLKLVFPVKRSEEKDKDYDRPRKYFEKAGISISSGLNCYETVFLSKDDKVPDELLPYVDLYRIKYGSNPQRGIRFIQSEDVCAPDELRKDWHLGCATERLISLQGPGWYSKDQPEYVFSNGNNVVGITERDPGDCVVCRGEKGFRRHFGVISFGPDGYLNNIICEGCAESTFASWLNLLKTAPIKLKEKKEKK